MFLNGFQIRNVRRWIIKINVLNGLLTVTVLKWIANREFKKMNRKQ